MAELTDIVTTIGTVLSILSRSVYPTCKRSFTVTDDRRTDDDI